MERPALSAAGEDGRGSIREWPLQRGEALPERVDVWLESLPGPVHVCVPGRDRSRSRVFVTLLHGDEPSGLWALHAWLREGREPRVDLHAFALSVEAAQAGGYRMLPGQRDLNRCFRPPFADAQGQRAGALLERVRAIAPEALVDVHNTSQPGPAYAVATRESPAHAALVRGFCGRVIQTGLRLGTLIEALEEELPCVVVECGGAGSEEANRVARRGLEFLAHAESVCELPVGVLPPAVLRHPLRTQVRPGASVAFAPAARPGVDVTLRSDLDRHCFEPVEAGALLGWLGDRGLEALALHSEKGEHPAGVLFEQRGAELLARVPLELLMVTTRVEVALGDCLFYAVRLDGVSP